MKQPFLITLRDISGLGFLFAVGLFAAAAISAAALGLFAVIHWLFF